MKIQSILLSALSSILIFSSLAEAQSYELYGSNFRRGNSNRGSQGTVAPGKHRENKFKRKDGPVLDDSELVAAVSSGRRVDFVEAVDMEVVELLPDDTSGLQHQKWVVRLSNGVEVEAVYNTDMCPHVPLRVGDKVNMGGQFIPMGKGGLIHWLHHDPRGNRPDGYVELDGKVYCGN